MNNSFFGSVIIPSGIFSNFKTLSLFWKDGVQPTTETYTQGMCVTPKHRAPGPEAVIFSPPESKSGKKIKPMNKLHALRLTLLFTVLLFTGGAMAQAYQYYVPLPEQQIHNAFTVLYSGTGTTYTTVISIVPTSSNTLIYYDEWEDGYEANIGSPVQSTTKIFGDGNAANGAPPGYPADPPLVAGRPLVFKNNVTLPRNPSVVLYDGRDKFASTQSLATTRSSWATTPGTVLADAIEYYNTKTFGTFFYFPIGQNTPSDNSFTLVSLCVQASQNATQVQIDKDGNGTTDVTAVINQGESYQVNGGILSSGTVTSTKPVQVSLITGRIGGTYASRWYNLLPIAMWDNAYYTPVGTQRTDARSEVFVFNPGTSSLTVSYQTASGSGSFSVGAKATYRYAIPLNSSLHLHAASPFYAIGATDMDAANNLTWDWGYTLVPETFLTNSIYVGWGPGADGNPIPSNGNPVWVCSTEDLLSTTLYVDLDGDPTTGPLTDINGDQYDFTRVILPYGYTVIYDNSDKDQTGMHVYTLDGKNIVAAWGEDAATASPGNPFLDVGTTIPPDPDFIINKVYRLIYDPTHTGLADPGDTILFILRISNYTLQPYTDIYVYDTLLSPMLTYVPNTTRYNLIPLPDDLPPNTPYPIDQNGYYISLLPAGALDSITFKCVATGPITASFIPNRTTAEDNFGSIYKSDTKVPAYYNPTTCTINFTNSAGSTVTFYNENSTVYVLLTDGDQNLNSSAVDSVKVTITASSGDSETLYLLESGINTGIFGHAQRFLPTSKNSGAGSNNGTLFVQAGQTIAVSYTDAANGDVCNINNVPISGPSFRKPLYLSNDVVTTGLDRVKPWEGTAINTSTLSTTSTGIAVDATNTRILSGGVSNTTINHTTGTGLNRLMLVGISMERDAPSNISVSSVTYGTQSLSLVGAAPESGEAMSQIWYLVAPNSGSGVVTVNFSGGDANDAIAIGVTTFTGVNQTTPYDAFTTSTDGSSPATITVNNSSSGDLIFAVISLDDARSITASTSGGQSELWDITQNQGGTDGITGGACTKPGAAGSVSLSWTISDDGTSMIAIPINPAPANTTVTFTQNPVMCGNLSLPAGGLVKVKLWLVSHSGMGGTGSKTISATIKKNGTGFITINSAAFYDQSGTANDTLVFSGALASAVSLANGDIISMDITTSLAGASFQISYDATTVPSMLRLPASNVIDFTQFALYNAAYPSGSIITNAYNGETVYVRATVTDPFGYYDIHDVALRITDPSLGNTDVAMTPVDSTGCTKTFQYIWPTGTTQGNYTLRAIASEGYENEVKDTTQTIFNLQFLDTGTPCSVDFTNNTYTNPVTSYPNANGTLYFRVQDFDQNLDPLANETVSIIITSSNGDQETRTLTETGPNTGIFTGNIPYTVSGTPTQGDNTITAAAGVTLSFNYTDPDTPSDVCTDNAFIAAGVPALSASKNRLLPSDLYCVVGDTVRWQIIVTNPGTTNHTNIALTDTYNSTCLTYVSASPTPSGVVPGTLTWNTAALGGTLNAGQSRVITVTFLAASGCGATLNTATATATGVPNAVATSPVTIDNPSITITKTRTSPINTYVFVGTNITFQITVTNTGNTTASTVPLVDTYSDYNFSYVSSTPPADAAGAGQVNWNNIGPIAPLASVNVSVTFNALHGNQGEYVINNASVDFAVDEHGNPIPSVNDSARLYVYSPPVAINDTTTTLVDTPVQGTVMGNDYDDDGDVIVTNCTPQVYPQSGTTANGGTYTINNDGTYTYTPPPGWTGTDSFDYQVCDPTAATDNAKVVIHVVSCFDPPDRPGNVH